MSNALLRRLIIVVALAGFGKTTLDRFPRY